MKICDGVDQGVYFVVDINNKKVMQLPQEYLCNQALQNTSNTNTVLILICLVFIQNE